MAEPLELVFKKGQIVYRQHEYELRLYDILYGSVSLYQNYGTKKQILIKEIGSDGYFGEMELIEVMPRTTTAVANERTHVKVYTAEDFGKLFETKPAMVVAIMQQMSARIRELTRLYNDACRIVSEAVAAERAGRRKSEKLQSERRSLSDYYQAYLKLFGGKQTGEI